MNIGEKGGAVNGLSKLVGPFFNQLFPEIPKNHPSRGSMMLNFCANMLGLDNAATPMGLKAMDQLQEINPKKNTASNAQIMFLVLNTSGLTLILFISTRYKTSLPDERPCLNKLNSNHRSKEEADSPTLRRNTLNASKKATIHGDQSPTKVGMSQGLRT